MTEKKIKDYLDNADNLDPIEGIWSFSSTDAINKQTTKQDNYAKVAIIKDTARDDRDYIEVLMSASDEWMKQTGHFKYCIVSEVAKTAYPNVYIFTGYKTKTEIKNQPKSFNAAIDESGLIRATLSYWSEGFKIESDVYAIRLYPTFTAESRPTKALEVSGSGVLLTGKGIVATNHHVIEGGKGISIKILKDGKSETYSAKVLTADKSNDIALLSIDDKDFLPISKIPYIVTTKADVGESVFTIGFPLNNIMGKNYKVTNGIISSSSGIQDDIRYYQITVPIQPGNSGGPLFNENGDIIGLTTSRLSGENIGTKIENANYAIKSNYLLLLTEMAGIKDDLPKQNQLASKELKEQVETLKEYVCLIHVIK